MDEVNVGIIPYGMDLETDRTLGPRSIRRLRKTLKVYEAFPSAEILVSACVDPTRSGQTITMGQLMANWLIANNVPAGAVRVELARTFNTEGEQDAGIACRYEREIHVSAWWHIPRIAAMRLKRGIAPQAVVSYRGAFEIPPLKAGLLEIGKFFAALLLPKTHQQALARRVKKLMRTSY